MFKKNNFVLRNLDVDESGDLAQAGRIRLKGIVATNLHGTDPRYLKLYNKATAPTVGTDTPYMTIPLIVGSNPIFFEDEGILFDLGLGVGATTAIADNSTAAPGANEVVVNLICE